MGVSGGIKRRRRLRVLGWTLLALVGWSLAFIGRLIYFGAQDRAQKCDVIIVLGAAVHNGEPSPAFAARIRHGIELWQRGLAPKLLFTGGLGHDGIICESEIARRKALEAGVPEDAILIEKASHVTWENLIEARRLMRAHALQTAVIVSDPEHLLRASMMADDLGLAPRPRLTPSSKASAPAPLSCSTNSGTATPTACKCGSACAKPPPSKDELRMGARGKGDGFFNPAQRPASWSGFDANERAAFVA